MNDQHSNNRELIAVRIRAPKPDGSPKIPLELMSGDAPAHERRSTTSK